VHNRFAQAPCVAEGREDRAPRGMVRLDAERLSSQFCQDRLDALPFSGQHQARQVEGAAGDNLGREPEHLRVVGALQLAYGDDEFFVREFPRRRRPLGPRRIVCSDDRAGAPGVGHADKPAFQGAFPRTGREALAQAAESAPQRRYVSAFPEAFGQ